MNCQKCNQPVETGAAYCGNCGQAMQSRQSLATSMLSSAGVNAPSYAVAPPKSRTGETQALLSLLFGITGIIGALFMALLGLVLGLIGLVLGTLARSSAKSNLAKAGIIASSLAILAGLAVWIYAIENDKRFSQQSPNISLPTAPAIAAATLSTPCYSTGFYDKLNVSHNLATCDMSAYNGPTLSTSSNAYKIYANKSDVTTTNAFMAIAKDALEKDVASNLAGFTVDSQQVGTFAGSPAYFINVSDKEQNVAVVEAAVFHLTPSGDNIFILVHAVNSEKADLGTLEAQWLWK